MTDDLEVHDVGIVVFMRAPGGDARDAAARAESALRAAIKTSSVGVEPLGLLDDGLRGTGKAMPVAGVIEVGSAARNGYLWTRPTGPAARERGLGV